MLCLYIKSAVEKWKFISVQLHQRTLWMKNSFFHPDVRYLLGRVVKNEVLIQSYFVIHQIKAKKRYLYWYRKYSTFQNVCFNIFQN